MRIVLDTNVVVSGLLVPEGTCGKILRLFEQPDKVLLISQPLLDELKDVLTRKMKYRKADADEVIQQMTWIAEKVLPTSLVEVIREDEADNRILECAIDGAADVIVSGDKKHLLSLKKFLGIPLLSPTEFLRSSVSF